MAVLAKPSAMSSEENDKKDSRHEFDHFSDRQIQCRLQQLDEEYDQENYERRLSLPKSGNNLKGASRSQKSGADDIVGWFPHAKFVARRNDVSKNDAKPKDTFIHPWRDYRAKKDDVYVFKHYTDSKKYAEQYRSEHGCLNARYPSGGQLGEMRRLAFQATVPPQQGPGQVTVQQQQQQQQQQHQQQGSWSSGSPPSHSSSTSLHYTNRKEPNNSPGTCSCHSKQNNYGDSSSQSHRYKLSPGQFSRTNTELRCHLDSDNSSESGDSLSRTRTPLRRISSATSSKSRHMNKSPTKISVPANSNPRAYPIQALTIQQNGLKSEVIPSPRPLDNLNCVAPEKQSSVNITRPSQGDNLGLSLRVQSLQDLLSANEVPLRGYALPKSIPPQPAPDHNGLDDTESDSMSEDEDDEELEEEDESIGKLSSVPKKANRHRRMTSEALQAILNDPVLSQLNQRPQVKTEMPEKVIIQPSSKVVTPESFEARSNDFEAIQKVNMWNPIVSTQKNEFRNQIYKKYMSQSPFRPPHSETRSIHIAKSGVDKYDCFSPSKTIRLSITRLDNAVSFCRTQVQTHSAAGRKPSVQTKGSHSAGTGGRRREEGNKVGNSNETLKREHSYHGSMNSLHQHASYGSLLRRSDFGNSSSGTMSPQVFDPYTSKMVRPANFDNKINLPLPQVKIFENVPVIIPNSNRHTPLPLVESAKTSSANCKSVQAGADLAPSRVSQNLTMESQEIDCNISFQETNQDKRVEKLARQILHDNENTAVVDSVTREGMPVTKEGVPGIRVEIVKKKTTDNNNNASESVEQGHYSQENQKGSHPQKTVQQGQYSQENQKGSHPQKTVQQGHYSQENQKVSHPQKKVQKPAVASGKFLRPDPELDGLTWAQKLEILRSVNKPVEKAKPKRTILKYIRDEPEELWESEHDQLYEQRRIRHLVEQARTKGGKQFDWVFEAQMRARGIDWSSDRRRRADRSQTGDGSGDSSDEEVVMETQRLGKYGIYVPPKKQPKVFISQSVQKSKSCLEQ